MSKCTMSTMTVLMSCIVIIEAPSFVVSLKFSSYQVQCGDGELERRIEEKIDLFVAWVEKHPNKKCHV